MQQLARDVATKNSIIGPSDAGPMKLSRSGKKGQRRQRGRSIYRALKNRRGLFFNVTSTRRPTSYLIQIILFIDFREMQPISAGYDRGRIIEAAAFYGNKRPILYLKILYLYIKFHQNIIHPQISSRKLLTPAIIKFHKKSERLNIKDIPIKIECTGED